MLAILIRKQFHISAKAMKKKGTKKGREWRVLTEFKPENPEKLQQIRDHFRRQYGVLLCLGEKPRGQIFRCRHYYKKNIAAKCNYKIRWEKERGNAITKCNYKIRWEKERGIVWESGQHGHVEKTGTLGKKKALAVNDLLIKQKNEQKQNLAAQSEVNKNIQIESIGETAPPEAQIYTSHRGAKFVFLAKIEDKAHLDRIRKAHGLHIWQHAKSKVRLRCSRIDKFPYCPYRGVYMKTSRVLYHRLAHFHLDNATEIQKNKDKSRSVADEKVEENSAMENIMTNNTVSKQPVKEDILDTVTDQPTTYYIDGNGQKWKLLAKIEDHEHFKRLHLSRGLKLHTYKEKTIQLYCSSWHQKDGRCPYRGLYLRGPRILYHRFAHNHPENEKKNDGKEVGKKGVKTTKNKKHNSRSKVEEPSSAENGTDQRSKGGKAQRSMCRKCKASSPVTGCSHSKIPKDKNEGNERVNFVLADFEEEFNRAAERPPLVFWRENGTFALAITDLATKSVGKMLLFLDRSNSMVEVCRFEGTEFTGHREKWAITESEQFRHQFRQICAEYLV